MAETKTKPKNLFDLGVQDPTLRVTEQVDETDLAKYIAEHRQGLWGDVSPELATRNAKALKTKGIVVSIRKDSKGVKFFIRTDLKKKETQILLPADASKKAKKKT